MKDNTTKGSTRNSNSSNQRFPWTREQNLRYCQFIEKHIETLKITNDKKGKYKIFNKMSDQVRSRSPRKCKSHHQKMMTKINKSQKKMTTITQKSQKQTTQMIQDKTKDAMQKIITLLRASQNKIIQQRELESSNQSSQIILYESISQFFIDTSQKELSNMTNIDDESFNLTSPLQQSHMESNQSSIKFFENIRSVAQTQSETGLNIQQKLHESQLNDLNLSYDLNTLNTTNHTRNSQIQILFISSRYYDQHVKDSQKCNLEDH